MPYSPREFAESLYCGIASGDPFVVDGDGNLSFVCEVTNLGTSVTHRAQFMRVQQLERTDAPTRKKDDPDYRYELSVIEIERRGSEWHLWFNPWYREQISFVCAEVELDGERVVGDGRWLQDELPRAPAV